MLPGCTSPSMNKLRQITLRGFRCFETLRYEPGPGLNFLTGANAQGKTSILEAVCVLLRLRSPRTAHLAEAIRFGREAFSIEGLMGDIRLSLNLTPPTRTLGLDGVTGSTVREYLSTGRIVWFGSEDLTLVSGPAERRRKLLDSAGLQLDGSYGQDLKNHDKALRSRNLLLRDGRPRREVEAYDRPLSEAGDRILAARASLVASLEPLAAASCDGISRESLRLTYIPGADMPMLESLKASRDEEIRLRQTRVGPQRDDVLLRINGLEASSFASEGQRRTVAVALKLAVAALLGSGNTAPPLLLLDDIFGELDPVRRDALLHGMPAGSQAILSTTVLSGMTLPQGTRVHRLEGGILHESGL